MTSGVICTFFAAGPANDPWGHVHLKSKKRTPRNHIMVSVSIITAFYKVLVKAAILSTAISRFSIEVAQDNLMNPSP